MKKLSQNDVSLMDSLINLSQKELHQAMSRCLRKYYPSVLSTEDYVVAWGDIPIALVAHMDTVFNHVERNELYYDIIKGVMWRLDGAGFDDRAGIFAILKIIQAGYRPTVIFTTEEEKGGIGAAMLVSDLPQPKVPIKYFIELDRQGSDDCVFYNCGNDDFIAYVESFGFNEEWGTFSDISEICPAWRIAGVNLSIGYYNEHSVIETLHVAQMLSTIEKVKKMLEAADDAPFFNYIYRQFGFKEYYFQKYGINIIDKTSVEVVCAGCGSIISDYNSIPVLKDDGSTIFYCGDCLPGNVDFCSFCGEAYEISDNDKCLCPRCRKKVGKSQCGNK